jgi:hypothetical protein
LAGHPAIARPADRVVANQSSFRRVFATFSDNGEEWFREPPIAVEERK